MKEGWRMQELGEIAFYVKDKIEAKRLNSDNYISADNMIGDVGGITKSEYVPVTGKSSHYMEKDILVSNIRPYFKKMWFATFSGGCSNDVFILRVREESVDSKFLFYRLSNQDFFDFMMAGANGTKMPRGNKNAILNFKVTLPPLETQKKIASILSGYDDLIENNLKRIKILEEMAQQTYEEWFVRMRFPGYESAIIKPETGLPEGWERLYFKDILNFKTGKLDSNALDSNGIYDFYTCAKEVYKTNTYCFEGEAVLLGGNNATGDFALFYADSKFDAYQRTYIVTSKREKFPLVYVYQILRTYLPHFKIVSSGASTKLLTMRILDKTKVVVPNDELLKSFNNIAKPCFESILNLQNQNQRLREARDILLPRLMMGMIEINKN